MRSRKKTEKKDDSQRELIKALNELEESRHIDKEKIMEAIEESMSKACQKDFGQNAVVDASMDRLTGQITVFLKKTVVEEVEDDSMEISLEDARMINADYELGDVVNIVVTPKNFGRIAAQQARNVIVQKIKEAERESLKARFEDFRKTIITGEVERISNNNIYVKIDDRTETVLLEKEQVPGEVFHVKDRIKLYVVDIKDTKKDPKIIVSRKHRDLVKKLFEAVVSEIFDGIVEIKSIAREAGSRTKIAVYSNDPNVDAVGACVGRNGERVNEIVHELQGEKIDIIEWDEDRAVLIKNALSPSEVCSVSISEDGKSARVVVPDDQLSLAIGKEGQNARLAAKLTSFKIDIKSVSQAEELEDLIDFDDDPDRYEDDIDTYDDPDAYEDDADAYEDDEYAEDPDQADDDYDWEKEDMDPDPGMDEEN